MAHLVSVNVGLPRDVAWQGKIVHTGIWKAPVHGRCMVRRLNIDGDGQGDRAGHGGEHRAVLVYQIDSYRYWQRELGRTDLRHGQFGENFTVDGLPDDEVCIGDRYRIGGALLEVTQPRVTCYRVGVRMGEPRMAALLVAHDRPGFYLRVLEEGEVEAGDEIVQVAAGPERMTVSGISALLYKPGHPRSRLVQALRIPALSAGWRSSFQALLERAEGGGGAVTGNPGLAPWAGPAPAWVGFRPLRVSRKNRESDGVTSLMLEPTDGDPLAPALPGQFIVLRLRPAPDAPALLRSYSLSGEPSDARYRVSIKREAHGVAGAYIESRVRVGDVLEASAPRGSFTLRSGDGPVILLSAGIGATPVLAMLHALAEGASPREVWWIHGARHGGEHAFAGEARTLLAALPRSHRHIRYSAPRPADRPAFDFDAPGRLSVRVLQELGVPRNADFYLCGPAAFLSDFTTALEAWGVTADRVHGEIFGSGPSVTPGVGAAPRRPPHLPDGPEGSGPLVSFARSNLDIRWDSAFNSLLEIAEACDVPVRWSCRTGVCHTCETGLVTGTVSYQPDPVEPPAERNVLICCSRPRGDIVIDL
jgi:ferredoxin-NADP reductase/MOSC domain-containing protein YiiM/ferredoxin